MNESNMSESLPQELLLLVFVHGFKGTDTTFAEFPKRLRHLLAESIQNTSVESIVFPAYEVSCLSDSPRRWFDFLVVAFADKGRAGNL
jgi:hypothetical protein